ncbi:MAG: Trm112 family protein [Deltaproteobacteria bacterium]|nr:Trm112 family protein [Deltaproteobacteria bacterium]
MAMPKDLLELLRCPKCKGELALRADASGFECAACRLLYPVIDGIPDFVIEEAKPL